jgi:hypothetical protein
MPNLTGVGDSNSLEQDTQSTTPQTDVKQQNYGVLRRQRPVGRKEQKADKIQK